MATKLSIWNRALTTVGELRVSGLTEDSVNARLLAEIYEDSKRAVLEMHSWRFARGQVVLAQNTNTPLGYERSFELPADFIKVLEFNNTDPFYRQKLSFEIVGQELHTSEDVAKITYLKDITSAGLFSSGFVECLSLYLGQTIAFSRTKAQTLMDRLDARFEKALARAKRADAGQDNTPRAADDGFPNIASRRYNTDQFRGIVINN